MSRSHLPRMPVIQRDSATAECFQYCSHSNASSWVRSPISYKPSCSTLLTTLSEVPTDSQGVLTSALREILESWPSNKPIPRTFYTVPYGCNPSGTTASIERRKELLALSRQYDFLILEGGSNQSFFEREG